MHRCFVRMKVCSVCLLLFSLLVVDCSLGQNVVGELRVQELESTVFHNTRNIRIWLPPGYDSSATSETLYPTLYLNDGQSLFDASTSLFGEEEWRVDEVADSLIMLAEIPPVIIVGIDNAGRRGRAKEYLPYPDEYIDPPEPNPQGGLYPEFLRRDVIPFVEKHYRVKGAKSDRYLGGSSYGALISQFVAIDSPDLFAGYLLESPSFYVENNRILNLTEQSDTIPGRVYLGVGTNELALDGCPVHPGNQEAIAGVKRMAEILRAKGLESGKSLYVNIESCAEHRESAWARRLSTALSFLLGQ